MDKDTWQGKRIGIFLATLLGCCFLFSLVITLIVERYMSSEGPPTYSFVKNSSVKELWQRTDIITSNFGNSPVTSQNTLFIIGKLSQNTRLFPSILAIDGINGALLWQEPILNGSTLYATSTTLYSGQGNRLYAYEPRTGKILWSTPLSSARNINHIYVLDGLIYIGSTPGVYHLIQADTGQIIKQFKEPPTLSDLQTVRVQLGLPEDTELKPDYFRGITLTETTSFYIKYLNGVSVVDIDSGNILWEIERGVVSNVAVIDEAALLMTVDGKLLKYGIQNGDLISSIQFEPETFPYSDAEGYIYAYFVAVDQISEIFYVYLGNSKQMFAFCLIDC